MGELTGHWLTRTCP